MYKNLKQIISDNLRSPTDQKTNEWVEIERLGFKWKLNAEKYVDKIIISNKPFENDSINLINNLVKPGMYSLDVGANFGYYTLLLSRLVKNGKVVAFEPTNHYSERLDWHIKHNALQNVRLEKIGLSDKNQELTIAIGDCSATLHWTADKAPTKEEQISLRRLDDWWEEYLKEGNVDRLNFIKVDIDGHEPKFIQGGINTLKKHQPIILAEVSQDNLFQSGTNAWEFADLLESLGYILCDEKEGRPFKNRREYLLKAGNFAYSTNILALPKK